MRGVGNPVTRTAGQVIFAIVFLIVGLLLTSCGSDEGDNEVSGVSVSGAKDVAVSTAMGTPGDDLGPGIREQSPVYEINGRVQQDRAARISFDIPEDFRLGSGQVLMAVTREDADGGWVLLPGTRHGDQFVVKTDRLSLWSLVSVAKNLIAEATRALTDELEIARGRSAAPSCDPSLDYHAAVSGTGGEDPILYACAEKSGGRPALHVYNNRAIALDYVPPDGSKVTTRGAGLSEAYWDAINRGTAGQTGGRLVPGAGEATIVFPKGSDPDAISFRATNQALATDVMVAALASAGRGGLGAAGKIAEAAACFWDAAARLGQGKISSGDWLGLFASCGGTLAATGLALPGAVLAGAIRTGAALADQLDLFTTVSVSLHQDLQRDPVQARPKRGPGGFEISFEPNGFPRAIGPFRIDQGDRTIADATRAFGEPSSVGPGEGGDVCPVRWDSLGLEITAVNFGGGGACTPGGGFVQLVVVRSGSFVTDRGLRVGSSDATLNRLYPEASTRGGDARIGSEQIRSGALYTLLTTYSPIGPGGQVPTLQAHVEGGVVSEMEVAPLLGGD